VIQDGTDLEVQIAIKQQSLPATSPSAGGLDFIVSH